MTSSLSADLFWKCGFGKRGRDLDVGPDLLVRPFPRISTPARQNTRQTEEGDLPHNCLYIPPAGQMLQPIPKILTARKNPGPPDLVVGKINRGD